MDAAGGGAAGVGILCVAENPQGQAGDEGAELGEPEDFDVCAGGGVRANFAVVDPGGAAIGKDDGGDCAVPGIAVRDFVGRDFDCGDGVVLQGGDAEFVVGKREDVVVGEFGSVGDVCGDDVGGVGVDVGEERKRITTEATEVGAQRTRRRVGGTAARLRREGRGYGGRYRERLYRVGGMLLCFGYE